MQSVSRPQMTIELRGASGIPCVGADRGGDRKLRSANTEGSVKIHAVHQVGRTAVRREGGHADSVASRELLHALIQAHAGERADERESADRECQGRVHCQAPPLSIREL
jgi:hypothetical protein